MNKPFEVCLLLVLLARTRGTQRKGQQQTGIEDEVILASLSS
jgi:hypothetical protein